MTRFLSVIVPAFNEAKTITSLLDKVLDQPCVNEVIIVVGMTDLFVCGI
jgi:glycosyltransferase involved in cell wall biosynthesis